MHVRMGLAQIRAAQSVLGLREATMAAFAACGYPSAYFVTPITSDRRFGRVHSANNMPAAWSGAYPERLRFEDPLPDTTLRVGRPLRWSEARQIEPGGRQQAAFFAFLSDLGFEEGLALPTYGPGARTGFVGLPAQTSILATDETVAIMHGLAQMSFLRYCELIDSMEPSDVRLSERELDVVYWIAMGKSNSVIAEILGISAETVDSYVRRAFRKLGVSDRTSAVLHSVLAGHLYTGFFRPAPEPDADRSAAQPAAHTAEA
ncbi:LuxR C-terminal-related transcriptional regulator [Novosphingobium sp. RD2P27]|uniref:LuxR C-terminal-related transcriptional regulator n=1 Tax=Novosphingobium kalidii TaxID=3230299 RepID=A0ABV2D486_9SPHN